MILEAIKAMWNQTHKDYAGRTAITHQWWMIIVGLCTLTAIVAVVINNFQWLLVGIMGAVAWQHKQIIIDRILELRSLVDVAPDVRTFETEDYIVSYEHSKEAERKCLRELVDFCQGHETFNGEDLVQSDFVTISAPELLAGIIDDIIKFDVKHK